MEIFFVQLLYLFRPILNGEWIDFGLLGFSFFELAAILLLLLLAAGFSLKLLHKIRDTVSSVEVWVILLITWSTISYIVHIDISSMSAYAKIIIPLMTYLLVKRILPDRSAHVRMVFLMLVGFLLPFAVSAVMTFQGQGLGQVIYWTGTERYKGIYANIHNMGHNAGFAMMSATTYLALRKSQPAPLRWVELLVVATVFLAGVYLLYASQARNVYVGIAAFFVIVLFFYDKRMLALFIFLSIAFLAYFWGAVSTIFFDFLDPQFTGEGFERAGSGRIIMLTRAFDAWSAAPFLNQLTGMGVTLHGMGTLYGNLSQPVDPWNDPHNDWLYALMALGLIGFGIIVGLFLSIFRAILRVRGKEKFALLGLFLAVVLMNALSNSYITRFSMFQMFFMLMVYADLRSTENGRKI